MIFFAPTDFEIFDETHAANPECDVQRVRLRDQLAWLHQQIYPEMRARRWDLHPHWVPQYLISTARLTPAIPRIDFLLLRYSKAETVVKLMRKELGEDFSHPYRTAILGIRADEQGMAVELLVTDRAWADAQNFKNKLVHGAPEKRHLRQLLAELGGNYTFTLEAIEREAHTELARVRCSRLVNLGVLDALFEKYSPGRHQLRVNFRYLPGDPLLEAETFPNQALLRLGQLYLLYQFISWSPRNNYLSRAHPRDQQSESNS